MTRGTDGEEYVPRIALGVDGAGLRLQRIDLLCRCGWRPEGETYAEAHVAFDPWDVHLRRITE